MWAWAYHIFLCDNKIWAVIILITTSVSLIFVLGKSVHINGWETDHDHNYNIFTSLQNDMENYWGKSCCDNKVIKTAKLALHFLCMLKTFVKKNDEFSNVHKLQNSKSFKFIHANLLIYFPTNLVYFQANLQLKMHSKSSF